MDIEGYLKLKQDLYALERIPNHVLQYIIDLESANDLNVFSPRYAQVSAQLQSLKNLVFTILIDISVLDGLVDAFWAKQMSQS